MIEIQKEMGFNCPFFVCEVCGEMVDPDRNTDGHYAYSKNKYSITFVHKGKCHDKFDEVYGKHGWGNIRELIKNLVFNSLSKRDREILIKELVDNETKT